MTDLWTDLLGVLELTTVESTDDTVVLEGKDQDLEYHRIFGGQLLGQFIQAALATTPNKAVKSLHVLFPREGRSPEPVRYTVTKHHEGGTFASLGIVAAQESRGVIGTASVSLSVVEEGREQQTIDPAPAVPDEAHRIDVGIIPWETRAVADLDTPKAETPDYELWIRTPEVDPALAPALTAYATDLTLIGTALRGVDGLSQQDAQKAFTSAVTSHTVWFHRQFRTDQWLVLRQHSPILAAGRTFGRGDVVSADGALVASYSQEALLRFK